MISWQTAAHWPYIEAPFPFYLVFYDRGPVSRVPAAAAGAEWAGPQEGGPRRMEVGRGETHGGVIITCLQDCRNCFRVILSGDNRVKKILTLPTIQLKLAIMIVFTTLITSMRYRVFCLVAMADDNYKIR